MSTAPAARPRRATFLAVLTLVLPLIALLLTPAIAAAATWSSIMNISDGARPAAGSALARTTSADHRYLHATWRRGAGTVEFARSGNGGETWSRTRVLARTEMILGEPRVAASGNDVWVAWVRRYEDPDTGALSYGIKARHNGRHGNPTAWDTAIRLTSVSGNVRAPSIAVTDSGNDIYVIFSDLRTDTTRLVSSHDGGDTWASTTIGTGFDEDFEGVPTAIPVVAANGDNVVVAWLAADGMAMARVSTNGGDTWTGEAPLGEGLSSASAKGGRLAVAGNAFGNPWVRVWETGSWGDQQAIPTVTLNGETASAVNLEVVLNSESRLAAVYSAQVDVDEETADTWEEITLFTSVDDGDTWSAPTRISRAGSVTKAFDADRPTALWLESGRMWIGWLYERAANPGTYFFALRELAP